MNQDHIRSFCAIAQIELFTCETPILDFSSRRQNGIHLVGLLFPAEVRS